VWVIVMDDVFKVTFLRANGSVWIQKFDSMQSVMDEIPFLIKNYPHIIISKTPFKLDKVSSPDDRIIDDYLRDEYD
jgi:hypothetical protein